MAEPVAPHRTWEYFAIAESTPEALADTLNAMDSEGWEPFSSISNDQAGRFVMVLRREPQKAPFASR
jgi:hypothetical protein